MCSLDRRSRRPIRPFACPCAVLACLLASWPASRAESPPTPSEPVFTGLLISGGTVSGRIGALDVGRVSLVGAENSKPADVPFPSLVKLTRDLPVPAPATEGSHLLLPGGEQLMRVTVGGSNETGIEVQSHSALGKMTIPLDCILGLVLTAPGETDGFDQLWDRLLNEPRNTEVVWLANGDRMTGAFLGIDDHSVKLQVKGKPIEIDRTGVVAIGFDPVTLNYPRPPADYLELSLSDGSRIGVTAVRIEKGQMIATTRLGQAIQVPVTDLVRIDPRNSVLVPLSERKIDAQNYVAYVGPTRPARMNRTVDGHPFRLGGGTYDRGLGTQSRTLLAYKLKPGDRRFQALVGVDERAGPLGSVAFRVVTDGQTRLITPPMTSRDQPRPVDIDISAAKLLILITEFADRGDVRDLADWVEARIIR